MQTPVPVETETQGRKRGYWSSPSRTFTLSTTDVLNFSSVLVSCFTQSKGEKVGFFSSFSCGLCAHGVFLWVCVFVCHLSPDGDQQLGPAFVVDRFVQNHVSTVGEVNSEEVCIGLRVSHHQFILLGG